MISATSATLVNSHSTSEVLYMPAVACPSAIQQDKYAKLWVT